MFGTPKENSLWVEKYRPKNLDSYVGNENLKKKVSRYLKEGDVPHLLLFGNAGTGKTTLAKLIVKNIECDHINISSEGDLKGNIKSLNSTIGGKFVGDVFADTLAIESTASIRGNLYYNNLKAQPGAKLDVQLIKGLEKKEKSLSSKKPKKV